MNKSKLQTTGRHAAKCFAKEKMGFDKILEGLPEKRELAEKILSRLDSLLPFPADMVMLEIGAAQGEFLIACRERGHRSIGLEPVGMARDNARRLSDHLGIDIEMVGGLAEAMPFETESVDLVMAISVIEHVLDVDKAFSEAYRVLKRGGVFWFNAASSMCPKQGEIRKFPLFGWYPNPLKLKIMDWAKRNRPELIGYTETPAINWFTPGKAHRLLLRHGFKKVFDRWHMLAADANMGRYRLPLKIVSKHPLLKYVADVVFTSCGYVAVK